MNMTRIRVLAALVLVAAWIADGRARYLAVRRTHPGYINTIPPTGAFALTHGRAITYHVGAVAFGLGIQAETTHSTSVAQTYAAGSSRARRHYVWGDDANLSRNPHVEYSY